MKTNELLSLEAKDYYAAPGVSASMLDKIRISPAHLKAYMDGELSEESDALNLGTLCHRAIFEPDTLTAESVCMQPETIWIPKERRAKLKSAVPALTDAGREKVDGDKAEILWNGQISECKEWVTLNAAGRPVVDAGEWNKAVRIRDNAHRDGTVRALLSHGYPEQALFVEDGAGTLRKSKFDYISTAGNCIPDLKTCRSAHPDKFEKAIENLHYHIRAAYYLDNAELAGLKKDTFVFICVETAPPFLVACYQLCDEAVEFGRRLYQGDIQLYRNCVESGRWPGYHQGIREIGLPPWIMRQIQSERIDG